MEYTLLVNGTELHVAAPGDMPLLWLLREKLAMTGTKFGCGAGLCGACTVHLDGMAVRSCLTTVDMAAGKAITTIEGLGQTVEGRAVQDAWIAEDVVQCGYCQPGQMLSAAALLAQEKAPDEAAIDAAMSGNICRCGTYPRIRKAVRKASDQLSA